MSYDRADHAAREGVPVHDLPLLNPDPLRAPATDVVYDPEVGAWVPRPSALLALFVGLAAGAILGALLAWSIGVAIS